jgi:hypothetical protein
MKGGKVKREEKIVKKQNIYLFIISPDCLYCIAGFL